MDDKEHIAQVATIASREAEIGQLISEALRAVGNDGVITVEEGSTLATELEITEGLQFDKGYLSPYFVTDAESMESVLEDAYVLLHRDKIGAIADLLPLLEKVLGEGKPLLIVAEDLEGEALSTLVVNSIRKTIRVAAVKSPFFGDRRKAFMDDLAVATGGTVINPEVGLTLSEAGLDLLGRVRRAVITKDTTTLVEGGGHRRCRARAGSRRSRPRSSPRTRTGTARSCRSGWPSCPAASPSSRSGRPPRPRSRSASTASRTRCRPPGPRSRRASCPAAAPRWCRRRRRWKAASGLTGDEATGVAVVRKALSPRRCSGSPPTAVWRVRW